MWYRAFCRSAAELSPLALAEQLHTDKLPVEPHFSGDDLGWTEGRLVLPGGGSPVAVSRYLIAEDGLRRELNAFAAEIEAMTFYSGRHELMEWVIQTQQLIALRRPLDHADEATLDRLCLVVVGTTASACDGVVQIDGRGWFDATGKLLVAEY